MKWFQHRGDSHEELGLQILIEKCGMEGYGFYFFIKERICRRLEGHRATFTTEEGIARLAQRGNIELVKAYQILEVCLKRPSETVEPLLDLEPGTGHIRCREMLWELDTFTATNAEIAKIRKNGLVLVGERPTSKLLQSDFEAPTNSTYLQDLPSLPGLSTGAAGGDQGKHFHDLFTDHIKRAHKGEYDPNCDACKHLRGLKVVGE